MSPASSLAFQLAARLDRRPVLHAAVARAVADEDTSALASLFGALGLDCAVDTIEGLLDGPGPFRPSLAGCT